MRFFVDWKQIPTQMVLQLQDTTACNQELFNNYSQHVIKNYLITIHSM